MSKKVSELTQQETKSLIRKIIARFSLFPFVLGLLIFLPAGTCNYWQVYLYITVLFIPMIFVLLNFLKNDPRFLERRTRTKEKEKQQKIIQFVFTFFFFSCFIVCGFDKRLGWSDIPISIVILADIFVLLGYILVFSSSSKIATLRGLLK